MTNTKKLGFSAVFSIVVGSQIGSGVFMLPSELASFGIYSLFGWLIASIGAISLALVFSKLCIKSPKTGGIHAYVQLAFGNDVSFFTGFTYWIISWVSTTAIITASVSYLIPLIGDHGKWINLIIQLLILFIFTLCNLRGVYFSGIFEIILSNLKIIPLLILPLIGFFSFDWHNFEISQSLINTDPSILLSKTTLLAMWAFLGIECATTPAGSIENPTKTIPKAVMLGTLFVAFIYIFNSFGIMGSIKGSTLMNSTTPYVDVASNILPFSKSIISILMCIIAVIICLGTLNAWILSSGQVALGCAIDNIFSKCFLKTNKYNAPIYGILFSSFGMATLLFFTLKENLRDQIKLIIDLSVISFLYVYIICACSLIVLLIKEKSKKFLDWAASIFCVLFCLWIIKNTNISVLCYSCFFTIFGVPFYFLKKYNDRKNSLS